MRRVTVLMYLMMCDLQLKACLAYQYDAPPGRTILQRCLPIWVAASWRSGTASDKRSVACRKILTWGLNSSPEKGSKRDLVIFNPSSL